MVAGRSARMRLNLSTSLALRLVVRPSKDAVEHLYRRLCETLHFERRDALRAARQAWCDNGGAGDAVSESGLGFAPVWTRQVRNLGPDSGMLPLVSIGIKPF